MTLGIPFGLDVAGLRAGQSDDDCPVLLRFIRFRLIAVLAICFWFIHRNNWRYWREVLLPMPLNKNHRRALHQALTYDAKHPVRVDFLRYIALFRFALLDSFQALALG